ncbi:MAG: hypothetical protein KF900_10890 [Bacteroidetes bacterium]|nr:hypothetical protein [Bacteroidota bacterium]
MKFGNLISFWFGAIMIVLVTSGAFAFTFTNFMDDRLFGTKRVVFILILIAYAIYRGFRLYHLIKNSDDK